MGGFTHRPPTPDRAPDRTEPPAPLTEDAVATAQPAATAPTTAATKPPDLSGLFHWAELFPTAALPKASDADLIARANKATAEKLLTTGELRTPQMATQAMQLLIDTLRRSAARPSIK